MPRTVRRRPIRLYVADTKRMYELHAGSGGRVSRVYRIETRAGTLRRLHEPANTAELRSVEKALRHYVRRHKRWDARARRAVGRWAGRVITYIREAVMGPRKPKPKPKPRPKPKPKPRRGGGY